MKEDMSLTLILVGHPPCDSPARTGRLPSSTGGRLDIPDQGTSGPQVVDLRQADHDHL